MDEKVYLVGQLIERTIDDLSYLYLWERGQAPTTLHCHPATLNLLKHELSPDIPNIQDMDIISFRGMRVIVDTKLSPGVLYVDGD